MTTDLLFLLVTCTLLLFLIIVASSACWIRYRFLIYNFMNKGRGEPNAIFLILNDAQIYRVTYQNMCKKGTLA